MKKITLLLLMFPFLVSAQEVKPQDINTIDGLIIALYESISGDAGEPRQWERLKSLIATEARLISTTETDSGNVFFSNSVDDFIKNAEPYFMENGFYEYETHRETQSYGRVVHLMSTYASKRSMDEEPFNTGVNSIQLFNDGSRWWVLTIYWAHESEANPIPPQFLSIAKAADPKDVESIDGVIGALYGSISGGKEVPRQWDRFRSLFTNDAKLIPSGKNQAGKIVYNYRGIEEYITQADKWFLQNGFFESEIHREIDRFGNIAHVFSTYISKRTEDGEPFARGINSIQLLHDGTRWWIMNIYWTGEREDLPIPEEYLDN